MCCEAERDRVVRGIMSKIILTEKSVLVGASFEGHQFAMAMKENEAALATNCRFGNCTFDPPGRLDASGCYFDSCVGAR